MNDWTTRISIACSKQLDVDDYSAIDHSLLMHLFCQTLWKYPKPEWERVKSLTNSPVILAVAALYKFSVVQLEPDPFPPEIFKSPIWSETVQWCLG